jgi:hypothetical protein
MKSAFAAMLRAGITRAVFSARCDFLDRRGFLALNQIQTPTEMAEEHAWVRPGHWRGPIPRPGEEIRFSAHLEPYWRDDGSYDIGLFRCRRLE